MLGSQDISNSNFAEDAVVFADGLGSELAARPTLTKLNFFVDLCAYSTPGGKFGPEE